ncbi:MAG: hypothetical protein LLF83_01375 [Methanobacterium sp.]|nr:hypothetical protein [Methanobacterium sp.]
MEIKNLGKKFLDKKLYSRLRVLILISAALTIATIYEVIAGFSISVAVFSLIFGFLVGLIVSRMYHLSWDDETHQVISNMDWIGAIIFLCYLIFIVGRTLIVGYWVQGTDYFGIIISITAGVMIGRITGTRHSINKIKKDLETLKKSLSV